MLCVVVSRVSLTALVCVFRPFRMEDLTEEELNEPMSQMDKARLSSDIKLLPQDKINRVLQIIAEAVPVAKLANENDEVELDINAFDTRCLRMLEGYVRVRVPRLFKLLSRASTKFLLFVTLL